MTTARLDLELVDQNAAPTKGDTIVTWGSQGGAPYVSGVPIGRVTAVFASLRESTQRAVIEPFVDFGALDLVGIVVPSRHATATAASSRPTGACDEVPSQSLVAGGLVVVALVLQVAVFPHLVWDGIVPNFCLLVVVAAALVRGPAVRRHPRLLRRAAARPRPAGRPRRRSLGARPRRRRLRRRADASGHAPPDGDRP